MYFDVLFKKLQPRMNSIPIIGPIYFILGVRLAYQVGADIVVGPPKSVAVSINKDFLFAVILLYAPAPRNVKVETLPLGGRFGEGLSGWLCWTRFFLQLNLIWL